MDVGVKGRDGPGEIAVDKLGEERKVHELVTVVYFTFSFLALQ